MAVGERLRIERETPSVTPVRYEWAHGAGKGIPAKVAAHEFLTMAAAGLEVIPAAVVERARPTSSPLHPAFEWNDAAAADQWRLAQAGTMLRQIVVRYADETGELLPPQRLLVKLQTTAVLPESDAVEEATKVGRYITVDRVMSSEDMRRRYIQQALAEARSWMRRYRNVAEFAAICAAIREVAGEIEA